MAPGAQLLVQAALELTPVVVGLVRKSLESELPVAREQRTAAEGTDFRWQRELAAHRRETLLQVAAHQRETALRLPEVHRIFESWPLRLYPSQILQSHTGAGPLPLRIFLGLPETELARVQPGLVERLRAFLAEHYPLHDPLRPTEFLPGAWQADRFHGEASIKALFGLLRSEPTLVIESQVEGETLYLRVAYWGLNQAQYYYRTVLALPYRALLRGVARSRALAFGALRTSLLAAGEDPAAVDALGGNCAVNLGLIAQEERWRNLGIDASAFTPDYRLDGADYDELGRWLAACHCLLAAWMADVYFLAHFEAPPRLPALLGTLVRDLPDAELVGTVVSGYRQMFRVLEDERRGCVAELSLQLAEGLLVLGDRPLARELADDALRNWLALHGLVGEVPSTLPSLTTAEREYLQRLAACYAGLGEHARARALEQLLVVSDPTPVVPRSRVRPGAIGPVGCEVLSLAFAPDGRTLVGGATDRLVRLWDMESGRLLHALGGHDGAIAAVAVSADGTWVVSGSSDDRRQNLKIWNLAEGVLVRTLFGHNKPVHHLAIAPNGQLLASCSNKVKLWDLKTGERRAILWHGASVRAVGISPDGNLLASAGEDGRVRLWRLDSHELVRTLTGHGAAVHTVAFSGDRRVLASGDGEGRVRLWELVSGALLHTLDAHRGPVHALAFAPDGLDLASGGADGDVRLWEINTCSGHTFAGHTGPVRAVAFAPSGARLASGGADGTVRLWPLSR